MSGRWHGERRKEGAAGLAALLVACLAVGPGGCAGGAARDGATASGDAGLATGADAVPGDSGASGDVGMSGASVAQVGLVSWLTEGGPGIEAWIAGQSGRDGAGSSWDLGLSSADLERLGALGLEAAVVDAESLVGALTALAPIGAVARTTSPSVSRWSVLAQAAGERAGELRWADGRVMELSRGTPTLLVRAWPERVLGAEGVGSGAESRLRVELVSQHRGWRFGRVGARTEAGLAAGRVFWETALSVPVPPGRALVLWGRDESGREDERVMGPPTEAEVEAIERGEALRGGARYADLYMSGPLRRDGGGGFTASRRVVFVVAQAREAGARTGR